MVTSVNSGKWRVVPLSTGFGEKVIVRCISFDSNVLFDKCSSLVRKEPEEGANAMENE